MEEVFKRENDKMVKLIQHDEKSLTNQEVYNHWASVCTKEAQLEVQLRQIQAQLDMLREDKEKIREIAKDCEKRIPKDEGSLREVKEDEK